MVAEQIGRLALVHVSLQIAPELVVVVDGLLQLFPQLTHLLQKQSVQRFVIMLHVA